MKRILNRKNTIYILPLLYFIWYLFYRHLSGPYYLSVIDPEYPYLINGLSCSILGFERIGHTDHPGTAFQILTAVFLRITHIFTGNGTIVDDVIARPESYLTCSSLFLFVLISLVLVWLGRIVYSATGDYIKVLIIQSSVLLNDIIIDLPSRYIPDIFLMLIVMILAGFTIKKYHEEAFTDFKYAISAGILIGLGLATKINLMPIVILPLIIILNNKNRLIYFITFILVFFITITPILPKFNEFIFFVMKIIKYDGLYGEGTSRILSPSVFINAIISIIKYNIQFSILLGVSGLFIIISGIKPSLRQRHKKELLVLFAVIITSILSILLIAKHYKNYYVIPMVSLGGLTLYFITMMLDNFIKIKRKNLFYLSALFILVFVSFKKIKEKILLKPALVIEKSLISDFWNQQINKNTYAVMNDCWMAGPSVSFAFVYGFRYVDAPNKYFNRFQKEFSNILTWDGDNNPVKYLMMIDADNESILKSGKSLFLFSSPNRKTYMLENYIEKEAASLKIILEKDTVFSNSLKNEYIICYKNKSDWRQREVLESGFEKNLNHTIYTDDEKKKLTGPFKLSRKYACNGNNSIVLDDERKSSPYFILKNIETDDFLEITVKWKIPKSGNRDNVSIDLATDDSGTGNFKVRNYQSDIIKPGWVYYRLCANVIKQPLTGCIRVSVVNSGSESVCIDDFVIKHFTSH